MKRALLIVALLGSATAMADNTAVINNSGQQYDGVLSINQAAGNQQQMSNSRAIALGGQATNVDIQRVDGKVDPSLNAKAAIQGNSFSSGNGVLGINQAAGANNQSINAVRISLNPGPQSIDDKRPVATEHDDAGNRLRTHPHHWQPPGRDQRPGLHRQPRSDAGGPECRGGEPSG